MATQRDMRQFALSMPEAIEKQHFGEPDFRVHDKIFAGLKANGERAWLKLGKQKQAQLVAEQPKVFTPAEGAWGRSGWTYVVLSQVQPSVLRSLVEEAWRTIAPHTLVAQRATGSLTKRRRARPPSA